MKNGLPWVILGIVIITGAFYFYQTNSQKDNQPSPTPTATVAPTATFCLPSNLEAYISSEGAAGSTYDTLNLKNISETSCQIQGDKFVKAITTALNVNVTQQGAAGPQLITLNPNMTVYSQVRYPNGAQCGNGIQQSPVSFQLEISPTDSITFKNTDGEAQQSMATCNSASEMTEVQVWGISDKPVTE